MISRPAITVLSLSAVVGAVSAVISVAAYRNLVNREVPIPVPSKLIEPTG